MNGTNRGADDSRAPGAAPLGYAMAYRVLETA